MRVEEWRAAIEGEPRLLGGGNDLKPDSGRLSCPFHELLAIAGASTSFGRDGADGRDASPAHRPCADGESFKSSAHRRFRQHARAGQTLPQTNDTRERVD